MTENISNIKDQSKKLKTQQMGILAQADTHGEEELFNSYIRKFPINKVHKVSLLKEVTVCPRNE